MRRKGFMKSAPLSTHPIRSVLIFDTTMPHALFISTRPSKSNNLYLAILTFHPTFYPASRWQTSCTRRTASWSRRSGWPTTSSTPFSRRPSPTGCGSASRSRPSSTPPWRSSSAACATSTPSARPTRRWASSACSTNSTRSSTRSPSRESTTSTRWGSLQRVQGAILQRLQGEILQRVQGDTLVLQRARCAILQRLLGAILQRLQGETLYNVYRVRYYVYKVKLCNVYRVTLVLQRARGAILYSVNKVGYWSNTLCNVYKVRHWSRTLQRVRGRILEFDTIRRTCIRWLGQHTPSSRLTYWKVQNVSSIM